MMFNWVATVLL